MNTLLIFLVVACALSTQAIISAAPTPDDGDNSGADYHSTLSFNATIELVKKTMEQLDAKAKEYHAKQLGDALANFDNLSDLAQAYKTNE